MKVVLLFLVLLPTIFAVGLYDEEIDKRLNLNDLIRHLKNLDLSEGCEPVCHKEIPLFPDFFCKAACQL
uniref:Uncharacterized protein n=1 Tax=Octopus bimaculoides TaxID=37653 RepID=A0A0L8GV61_OCTBM